MAALNAESLRSLRAVWGATIPERKLGHFFANFGRLLTSGTSVPAALESAAKSLDPELEAICASIEPRLRAGVALHEALGPHRLRFPEMVIPVIEVGEVAGKLDEVSGRLAAAFQEIDGVQARFKDVAVEPVKAIGAGVAFRTFFAALGGPWIALQVAITTLIELTLLYVLLRVGYLNLWRWPKLHILVDKIHLAIPHVGAIERNLATARWGRSFTTMWHSGVPISDALDVASRSTLNAYYERELQKAVHLTRQGRSLTQSLEGLELAPSHLLPLLKVGEETAKFGEALDKYVDALEDEALVKAQQESTAAMAIGYLIVGLIVLMIAFGLRIPWLPS